MIWRSAVGLLALYLVYASFFFLIQRRVLYPGTALGPGPSWPGVGGPPRGVRRIELATDAGTIDAWLLLAGDGSAGERGPDAGPRRPGALVFHGNAELAIDLVAPFEPLSGLGIHTLFVEYPGFGGSDGRPSETSIQAAARAAYDWLAGRPEVDPGRIVAIGRSLGTGPAAGLSRERPVAALVLWSPFVSVGYLALRKYGLPPFLALDRFDTRVALRGYDGPILMMHGRRDRVIPYGNAEVLLEAADDAELVAWDCGHNDCPPAWLEFWDPLSDFLHEEGILDRPGTEAAGSSG